MQSKLRRPSSSGGALSEDDAAVRRAIEYLGQGKFALQDRRVVAVARLSIGGGERVRQAAQPLAQQTVDLRGGQFFAIRCRAAGSAQRNTPLPRAW